MARQAKVSKVSKKSVDSTDGRMIMPELSVRDTDVKYTGGEPLFATQPDDDRRAGALVVAFNWYSRYFDRKAAKEQLALYAENYCGEKATAFAKQLRRVDDKEVMATYGWLARLAMRGLVLSEIEATRLRSEITRLIQTLSKPEVVEKIENPEEVKVSNRPNVQEIMRERAREAAGELEGILDEFVLAGAKTTDLNVSPVGVLSQRNVLPQHISILSEVWKKKRDEFQAVIDADDAQLTEAYRHYGKIQMRNMVKFCDAILAGLGNYINVKKSSKAPRKRKAVPVEKQAAKVKFLKTFEELKLVSIHPSKIIGATEVWMYDTAKRKLWYLVADSHVGTLGIKGTTVLGFDAAKSGVKTLRKPAEVLKKLMAAGKPAARKLFAEVAAVHAQPNGRTNENLVILKAF